MLKLEKYTVGIGDRFAQQAKAQLRACVMAAEQGTEVIPVWNKSNREHLIIRSEPKSVPAAASIAVKELGWTKPWHVDADHIRVETVDRFIPYSDFFGLDVADYIGRPAHPRDVKTFTDTHPELIGPLEIPGIEERLNPSRADIERIAGKYLLAIQEASCIYKHIIQKKAADPFITEASMDETDHPQTSLELLIILAALADAKVPVQSIAPKFTGRFNKGVDYVGDPAQFEKEFNEYLAVISFAVKHYHLPENLKLSIHTGSDKFSLYGAMRKALQRFDAGLHLKTAGTTWIEEVIGLAEADGPGLVLAKEIYAEAYAYRDELCAPYSAVTDIDPSRLPAPEAVNLWTSHQFVAALRHDPRCSEFNPHLRQLVHVGYKIAALKGERYLSMVRECSDIIGRNVTFNLYDRHIKPLFVGI